MFLITASTDRQSAASQPVVLRTPTSGYQRTCPALDRILVQQKHMAFASALPLPAGASQGRKGFGAAGTCCPEDVFGVRQQRRRKLKREPSPLGARRAGDQGD